MRTTFKMYHDAGHGWLAVKRQVLEDLALINCVSRCSYVKGKTVYLEEDQDFTMFKNAYEQAYAKTFEVLNVDHGNCSFIRNYESFVTAANSTWVEVNNDGVVNELVKSEF